MPAEQERRLAVGDPTDEEEEFHNCSKRSLLTTEARQPVRRRLAGCLTPSSAAAPSSDSLPGAADEGAVCCNVWLGGTCVYFFLNFSTCGFTTEHT